MRHRQPWVLLLVIAVPLAGCATPASDLESGSEVEPREIPALQLDMEQPAPPLEELKPRFETTSWMVLEVETESGQPRFVIIDGGRKNGLQRGFRGRLIGRGRSIAEIEIVDVYDEGSRARISTELVDRITPQTAAEVDVPVGDTR
jgi:hypothetical protein